MALRTSSATSAERGFRPQGTHFGILEITQVSFAFCLDSLSTYVISPSVISSFSSKGRPPRSVPLLISKTCNVDAMKISKELLLKCLPGQILDKSNGLRATPPWILIHTYRLPNPKAMSFGFRTLGSIRPSSSRKRSGLNFSGSGNSAGSCSIALHQSQNQPSGSKSTLTMYSARREGQMSSKQKTWLIQCSRE